MRFRIFLIRIKGDAGHMTKLLPSKAIPVGLVDGLVNGAVVLTGPTQSPHIRGEVVLTESKVTLPGLVEKPIGAPATVEFEGMIPKAPGVVFDRLELIVPPIRLPIKGKIQLGERFSLDAALSTGTLSLSSVPEWIAKGGFEAGNIELSLDMKGKELGLENLEDHRVARIDQWSDECKGSRGTYSGFVSAGSTCPERRGDQTVVVSPA